MKLGYHADLVVFDAERVRDAATFTQPQQAAGGIDAVWVNGVTYRERAVRLTCGTFRGARRGIQAGCAGRVLKPICVGQSGKGIEKMERYGVEGGKGQGSAHMPFARAVEADGWLFVSGQTPMENGEVINGGIVEQTHKAIRT